ncbi:hypothetical protein CLAIMM_00345 [Cladophialophora immunda]|nr:hypothetical protein CLAIMM_00345 [Cladophialophora immunda]
MARIRDDDPISCSPTDPPSSHRVVATALKSHTRPRFTRTAVEIIVTTIISQPSTTDTVPMETPSTQWQSEDSQNPDPSPSTVNEVDLSTSAGSTAVETSSPTPLSPSTLSVQATSLSMTTVVMSSPFSSPSSTVSFTSSPTSTASSTSSTVNTLASPPSSAYTTGIYIALGIFLFFGILCALVTTPITANTIKGVFRRRGRASEQ